MELTVQGEPIMVFLLASLRIMAWLILVPPFSTRGVPMMSKIVLSMGLAFACSRQLGDARVPTNTWELFGVALGEVLIGAGMGFVTMLIFAAVSAAGSLIDVFGSFSMAQGFDPLGANMNSVFGKLYGWLATMILFATGGYLLVLGGVLKSFQVMPPGLDQVPGGGPQMLGSVFTMFFITAVQIALPMIAVLFLADLGLALLTKVAPQLNALNVMFPAKVGVTLMLVGIALAVLPEAVRRLVDLALEASSTLVGTG